MFFQTSCEKGLCSCGTRAFGQMRPRPTRPGVAGWDEYREAKEPKHTTSSVKHGGGSGMTWVFTAANAIGSLVFADDVTVDKNSGMVFWSVRQRWAKCFRAYWTALHSAIWQWSAARCKSNQRLVFPAKTWNVSQWPSQSPDRNRTELAFHLLKTRLKTNASWTAQNWSHSERMPGSATGDETPMFGDVNVLQTSGCNLLQRICNKVLKVKV